MVDPYSGQGGSYIVNKKGGRDLVERTAEVAQDSLPAQASEGGAVTDGSAPAAAPIDVNSKE